MSLVSGTGWDINGWLSSNSSSSFPPSSSSSSSSSSSLSLLDVELCLELVSLLDPWSLWCWCWDCSWNSWREKWRKCGADEGRLSSVCGRGLGEVWQILCLQRFILLQNLFPRSETCKKLFLRITIFVNFPRLSVWMMVLFQLILNVGPIECWLWLAWKFWQSLSRSDCRSDWWLANCHVICLVM